MANSYYEGVAIAGIFPLTRNEQDYLRESLRNSDEERQRKFQMGRPAYGYCKLAECNLQTYVPVKIEDDPFGVYVIDAATVCVDEEGQTYGYKGFCIDPTTGCSLEVPNSPGVTQLIPIALVISEDISKISGPRQ